MIQVNSRGKFIGSEQRHLHHMDQHNGDHEVRSPAVYGAQEPAQGYAVVQVLQAVPGFAGRGNVDQRQHDAGEDLQDEDGKRGAAEDVEPARRGTRHPMLHRIADGRAQLQTLVEPLADFL